MMLYFLRVSPGLIWRLNQIFPIVFQVIPSSLPIEGFKVFYRSLLPVSTQWAQWNVPKDHRAIVPGLERGYKYEFKVQPYSGKVFGSESNVKHLWVPEEGKSKHPTSSFF